MEANNGFLKAKFLWYSDIKKFGFIQDENGTDYFAHISALKSGYIPSTGDEVLFKPALRQGKPCAKEISKIREK